MIADGSRYRWRWGDWTSSAHEFLECRPWTPRVIDGRLCFSARNGQKWQIVLGDSVGRPYDDAYDIEDYQGRPLYIARDGHLWLLVHGTLESTRYPFQVTYQIRGTTLEVQRFKHFGPYETLDDPVWTDTQQGQPDNIDPIHPAVTPMVDVEPGAG